MYGNLSYSSGHIDPVVLQAEVIAEGLNLDEEEIQIITATAYLHDILEDTSATKEDLSSKGLPNMVVTAVGLLTRNSCESYNQYLTTITRSRIATLVKLADSMVNHRACMKDGKIENSLKYANNINYLSTSLNRWIR